MHYPFRCVLRDWLFSLGIYRDGRSNRRRDKIRASASSRARQRRWSAWSNLYHFNHDSAESLKSKLWRFFGFGFAKNSSCSVAACHCCSSTWLGHGHLMVSSSELELLVPGSDCERPGGQERWKQSSFVAIRAGSRSFRTLKVRWAFLCTSTCTHRHAHTHTHTHTHAHTAYLFSSVRMADIYRPMVGHLLLYLSCLQFARHFLFIVTHAHAHARAHIPSRAMGAFFPHTVGSVFRLSLAHTHTHTSARTHTHTHRRAHTHTCVCWIDCFSSAILFSVHLVTFHDLESWFSEMHLFHARFLSVPL